MDIKLHANAATTPRIRKYIQQSTKTVAELARELGLGETTVRRWKRHTDAQDRSSCPHHLQTTLSSSQEAIEVELRTNGMIERLDGRIADIINTTRLASSTELEKIFSNMQTRMLKVFGRGRLATRRRSRRFTIGTKKRPNAFAPVHPTFRDPTVYVWWLQITAQITERQGVRMIRDIACTAVRRCGSVLVALLVALPAMGAGVIFPPDKDRLTEGAMSGWYNMSRDRVVRSADATVGRYAVEAAQLRAAKGAVYLNYPRPRDLGLDLSGRGRVVFHYKCAFQCRFGLQTRDKWQMFWRMLPPSKEWRKVSFDFGMDAGWSKAGKPDWSNINVIYFQFTGPRGSKLLVDGLYFEGQVRGERVSRALKEGKLAEKVEKASIANLDSARVFFDVIGDYGEGSTRVLLNGVEVGTLPRNGFGARFWLRRRAVAVPKSRLGALLIGGDRAKAEQALARLATEKEVRLAETIPSARIRLCNMTGEGFRVSNVFVELRFRDGQLMRSAIAEERFGNVTHWDRKRRPIFLTNTSYGEPVDLPALAFPRGGAKPKSPGRGKGESWGCEITKLKDLFLETALVRNGRPACCIVPPPDPKYTELAAMIQDSIAKASKVTVPIKAGDKITEEDYRRTNLILLGTLATNRTIGRLVFDGFIRSQSGGPDGHVVQTVHNPFGYGHNVVFLGGATPDEVRRSVETFLPFIKPGKAVAVGHLRLIGITKVPSKHGEDFVRIYQKLLQDMKKKPEIDVRTFVLLMRRTHTAGRRFNRTGDPAWLAIFKAGIEACMHYTATLERQAALFPDTGLTGDPNSTRGYLVNAWDLVEEEPVFTDAERLKITNWLLHLKADPFSGLTPFYLETGPDIYRNFWNHVTGPAMDFFWFSHYFLKYYDIEDAKEWDRVAYRYMGEQSKSWRGNENACGYNTRTQRHILEYALAKPDLTYFENGNARKMAEQIMMVTDNLGISARFGSSGSPWRANAYVDQLNKIAWYYQDGRYLRLLPAIGKIYGFDGTGPQWGVDPKEPTHLIGVKALFLDRYLYNWVIQTGGAITAAAKSTKNRKHFIPFEKAFDKLTFRTGFDPQDQYMVIDGFARGNHGDFSGNAILHMSDNGRVFLASKDMLYGNITPNKFNAVTIIKDGEASVPPPFTGLEQVADFARTGFSETLTLDYAGVDWYRNVIWAKERYFVVIDRLCAREAASYCFRTFWRTPGDETELKGSLLQSTQQGEGFFIQNVDGSACVRTTVPQPAWGPTRKAKKGYEFAKPVFTELTQTTSLRLGARDSYAVMNLLYTSSDNAPRSYRARKVGPSAVLLKGDGSYSYIGVGDELNAQGLTVKASLFRVGPKVLSLVAGSLLKWRETTIFQANRPVSVELDLPSGKCRVETQEAALVEIYGLSSAKHVTVDGRPARLSGEKVRIPPGRHVIAVPPLQRFAKLSKELADAFGEHFAALPEVVYRAKKEAALEPMTVLRKHRLGGQVHCVAVVKLKQEPPALAAGTSQGKVVWLSPDGKEKWTRNVSGPVQCLASADVTGDGRPDILVGADELSVFDDDGSEVWKFAPAADVPVPERRVRCIYVADVQDDGIPEIFVGIRRPGSYLLNSNGKVMLKLRVGKSGYAYPTKFLLTDIDGDGVKEFFGASTWNSIHIVELLFRDGRYRYGQHKWWQRLLTGAHDILVEDLDGDGKKEIVFADGHLYIYYYPRHIGFNNGIEKSMGDAVTALCSADTDQDGTKEIIAGAKSGYVCAYRKTGDKVWYAYVGGAISKLRAGDIDGDSRPEVVAACNDQNVYVLDSSGRKTAFFAAGSEVSDLQLADLDAAAGMEIIAACGDGVLYVLKLR